LGEKPKKALFITKYTKYAEKMGYLTAKSAKNAEIKAGKPRG